MPPNDSGRAVQLSILDRLTDDEPAVRTEAPITREKSLRMMRGAVQRDLEALLNTIRIAEKVPETYTELRDSLWLYGLPDINSISLQNQQDEERLLRSLERAIQQFEPRLSRVRVTSYDRILKSRQVVEFHVEAMLMIEPAPERIAFDTILEIGKGSYRVKE
ncbi:MAG TPA: type VI secretion system baseplate subunit TssE [Bryobacteraceae bacterium]|jgi:type VI secretion system protein ImpF